MTTKDFQLIARVLNNFCGGSTDKLLFGAIVTSFADALEDTNPRFDRKRFLAACGLVEDLTPDVLRVNPNTGDLTL